MKQQLGLALVGAFALSTLLGGQTATANTLTDVHPLYLTSKTCPASAIQEPPCALQGTNSVSSGSSSLYINFSVNYTGNETEPLIWHVKQSGNVICEGTTTPKAPAYQFKCAVRRGTFILEAQELPGEQTQISAQYNTGGDLSS